MKQKDKWKYNQDGFISIEGYLSYFNKNWENEDWIMIMDAPRNIGKSWGAWATIENIWEKFNGKIKIGYCRTNGEKIKHAKENFNAKYRGKYYMNDSKIYKQFFDENGKEIMKDRIELGSVFALNQAENYKSGNFDNYQLFFWDEYNENTAYRDQYIKFLDLLKTVKRKTSPFHVLLVGNKVNESNDILHNLQVDFDEIKSPKKDYFLEISKNIWYVQIGNDTFIEHNPATDLINRLAVFNDNTNAYLNEGTYLTKKSGGIILYNKYVKPSKHERYYISFNEYLYEFGVFFKNSEMCYYLHVVNSIENEQLPVYSFDVLGDMRQESSMRLENEHLKQFVELLRINAKNNKLYYCEIDTKNEIELLIRQICD